MTNIDRTVSAGLEILRALMAGLLLLGCGVALAASSSGKKIELKLAYDDKDNFPFHLGEGAEIDWKRPGFVVEFLKLVGDELKIDIKFVRYPWKRCMLLTETNEIDGAFSASYSEERLKVGRYPLNRSGEVDVERRITDTTYLLYKLKSSKVEWDGKTLSNLQGRIGTGTGWSIGKVLRDAGHPVDDGAINSQNLLDMLVAGRIEVIATFDLSHKLKADRARYREVEQLKKPYQSKPYYLLLSHKFVSEHPDVAEKVWTTIGKLRDSPRVQKIRAKYQTP